MIAAYPLQWPDGWPRTKAYARKSGNFTRYKQDLSVTDGVDRLLAALMRFGIDRQDIVISTNVRTRLDGLPRSGEPKPDDPGVAVYWETPKRDRRVMAIDRYDEVADNLAAVGLTLDAMRAIERHGGAQILERAFTGFDALPDPNNRKWRDVLGIKDDRPPIDHVRARYRILAGENHPDRGGDASRMADINRAWEDAQRELA